MAYENNIRKSTIEEILLETGIEGLGEVIAMLINEAMLLERSRYLNVNPYERSNKRKDYANGFKPKKVKSRMGLLELNVPQVRKGEFYPSVLEKGSRSETALTLAVAEMYVQGVSTRRVSKIVEKLCGFKITSSEVSRVSQKMDQELESWRERPLGQYDYVYLDARYEKVRYDGIVRDCAILTAVGAKIGGPREVIGISVALSEAEVHWRHFLEKLLSRGLHGIKLIISDAHTGLQTARKAVFPSIPWQRCQFHLQQNAQAYATRKNMRTEIAQTIRNIFNSPSKEDANILLKRAVDFYKNKNTKLAEWMGLNIPEGFSVFDFPQKHRKKIRTNNSVERLNAEFSRRTRVARLFPNEDSLCRLISAIASEISDDWLAGRAYIANNENE